MAAKFKRGDFVQHKQGEFCVMMIAFSDLLGSTQARTKPHRFSGPGIVVGRSWWFGWEYKVKLQNEDTFIQAKFIEEELEAASAN